MPMKAWQAREYEERVQFAEKHREAFAQELRLYAKNEENEEFILTTLELAGRELYEGNKKPINLSWIHVQVFEIDRRLGRLGFPPSQLAKWMIDYLRFFAG